MMPKLAFVVVVAAAAAFGDAFMIPVQNVNGGVQSTSTSLNIFGGLKGAFANDDELGARENAGLKNGPKMNDQVSRYTLVSLTTLVTRLSFFMYLYHPS